MNCIPKNIFDVIQDEKDGSLIGADAKHENEKEERSSGHVSSVEEIRGVEMEMRSHSL